jgi:DNA polymerase-3 subunit delta'
MSNPYSWHQLAWQQIATRHQLNRLPHALLITGIEGLGKRPFAEAVIRARLCKNPNQNFEACGQCQSCLLIKADTHPDYTLIEPETTGKSIKIEQIRTLKEEQTLTPKISLFKTVLIDHAEAMNTHAFNSLLKLLEEPQNNTIIVLVTAEPSRLPITITSRCQNINIQTPAKDVAKAWLSKAIASNDESYLLQLLDLCQGAPIRAMKRHESGGFEQAQFHQEITHLFKGLANPIHLAASWQDEDLITRLHVFQSMLKTRIQKQLISDDQTVKKDLTTYWAISDCITQTIKLISSPNNLNKILLIEDFLVQVSRHAVSLRAASTDIR